MEETQEDRLESAAPQALWRLAAGMVLIAFALFFAALSPFFESNDDVGFLWIASGALYDEPSPYLIYQSIIIGRALSALYRLAPAVPWYPLYLYAFHALAWLLIARGLLELKSRAWAAAFFAIAFLSIGAPLMAWVQFSSTSMLVGFAAIAFYAMLDRADGPGTSTAALAGLVLAAAGVIRIYYTLGAILAFAAPLIIFALVKRRKLKRFAVFALAAGLASGGAALCDHLAYSGSPAWQRWLKIHMASHEIIKRPIQYTPTLTDELAKVGWSINDLELANALYRTDSELYAPAKLAEVGAIMRRDRLRPKLRRTRKELRRRIIEKHPWEALGVAALMLIALVAALARGRWLVAGLLVALGAYWFMGLATVAHLFERLPTRVLRPTFLVPLCAAFLAFEPEAPLRYASSAGPPWLRRLRLGLIALALTAAATASGAQILRLRSAAAAFQDNRQRVLADLEKLRRLGDEALLIKCGILGLGYLPVFDADPRPRLNFIMLGWSVGSPPWYDKLKRHGIDDLSLALIRRPDLYLLAPPYFERCMKTYMRQHYKLEIEATKVLELNGGALCAFSLRQAGAEKKR